MFMWPVQPALLKIGKRGPLGWSLHWASCYNCRGGNTRETPPMESQSSLCIQLTSIAICFGPITPVGFGPITALSLSISPFTGLHALSRQCGLQSHWEFIEAYVRKKNALQQALAEAAFSGAGGLRYSLCIVVSRHLWMVPNSWCWLA